jgi:hypothetical protein
MEWMKQKQKKKKRNLGKRMKSYENNNDDDDGKKDSAFNFESLEIQREKKVKQVASILHLKLRCLERSSVCSTFDSSEYCLDKNRLLLPCT